MVDSKHQWKAWIYLLPALILLVIFTVWPIINTVATAFVYKVEYKPATIQVENVGEETYRFFYTDDVGVTNYLSAVQTDDGSAHLCYVNTPDSTNSVFRFDEKLDAWTVSVAEKTYFIAATKDSDADLFEASEENVGKIGESIYPANLFSATPNHSVTTALDSKASYNFGLFKGVSEAFRYVLFVAEDGKLDTTDVLEESVLIRPEQTTVNGKKAYKLYYQNESKQKFYINATVDAEGNIVMEYSETEGLAFYYNKTQKAWLCQIENVEHYLGLANNRIQIHPIADITAETAAEPVAFYLHRSNASEAQATTSLMQGYAYRMGAHQAANGTQTYITTGVSGTNGLMLTTDFVNGETFSKFGIQNFTYVLTSKGSDFMVCLKNTFLLTIITVPISTILALLIAVALNSIKPLQRLLQTIFFLPYVTNSIAIGMVFAAMFNIVGINSTSESVGIINNILGVFGIDRINWINYGAESWASFTALIIYIVWNALPFKILILLGGLQSINKQYYDAAKIDSTPKWRVLTRITVPLLSPMLTYVVITSFIGGFKEYSSVVGIFGEAKAVAGGANMNTIVGHIQNHLTQTRDYGLAGAAALILFAIIFVVTMINLRISKKSTHY